ncbi:helix-turn-helix domain-containing protein [Streptomyces hirsutus]|uniref:helix-turn-helix domain-containing protein n=1 Tax=Streptomyces hirsutus TaxID=35620 RepID=UPI0036341293
MAQITCVVVFANGTPCTRAPYRGSKWCSACYTWTRRHGWADPNGRTPQRPKNTVLPFLKAAAQATTDECVDLTGWAGRPVVLLDGKSMWASRAVWILAHGNPGDQHVLHSCHRGDEGCVNIRHLRLGDDADNHQDRVAAGRSFVRIPRARAPRPARPGIRCNIIERGRRCDEHHPTEGMCNKHRRREELYGDPLIRSTRDLLTAGTAADTDECVMLPARYGRPTVRLDGVGMTASRAVWLLVHGDPGDQYVLHTCHRGQEGCINVRHLYLGTQQQNVADAVNAGRHAHGERNGHAKLTAKQVQRIRERSGTVTQDALAAEFGISRQAIAHVLHGRTWSGTQGPVAKVSARGERIAVAKLDEAAVRSIRSRYVRGSRWHNRGNRAALAEEYGVTERTIMDVVRSNTWGWLSSEEAQGHTTT